MTNLGTTLKSRDITLLTKVLIVKAMVFPIAMYGCEGPLRRLSAEELIQTVVLEKGLESSLDCKEIKPVNPKRNQH